MISNNQEKLKQECPVCKKEYNGFGWQVLCKTCWKKYHIKYPPQVVKNIALAGRLELINKP